MTQEQFLQYAELVLHYPLFTLGGTVVTPLTLLLFLVILLVFTLVARVVERVLVQRVFTRYQLKYGLDQSIARLLRYVIMTAGLFVGLQFVGINLSSFAVIAGFLSVGIGFGLQNLTSNFVAGLIMLFERPIKEGDRVELGDIIGDVTEIRMRATVITTLDNRSIIVPNSSFISENVINYSYRDPKIMVRVPVGVAYGSDMDKVREALLDAAKSHPRVLSEPAPEVRFIGFGDSSLDLQLLIWLPEPYQMYRTVSDMNFAIDRGFRAAGIEIPFPQRDLHLRSAVRMSVAAPESAA
ncbi:MAG: mechanosensitive ion channel [Planctomycetota bacterium]|nr:mechanosensitive ion channel [Planctomycetota bacterium]